VGIKKGIVMIESEQYSDEAFFADKNNNKTPDRYKNILHPSGVRFT
jgi:hypothetical protein